MQYYLKMPYLQIKMKYLLILSIITIYSLTINAQSIENSEFCKKCNCNTTDKSVKCQDVKIGSNISSLNFWIDGTTNASYEFTKISVRNAGLIHVMPLPASPVKVLDLSWNKIEILENGCFQLMQNLTEIDLSENDLTSELFNPDIFQVIYALVLT